MRGGGSADFFAGKYAGDVGCRQQNEAAAEGCEGEGKGGGEQRRKVGLRQQRKWQGIAKKCRPTVSELRLWRRKLKYQLQGLADSIGLPCRITQGCKYYTLPHRSSSLV
ncbi:uncharacterized protein A4U43_C04F31670 [Asparagus officinalis]|uniref:Uncharacterized protein n=1 Tax=Asparagus officinalis TaxID=4686 RepID=A0A5P1F507_ASPOF|nr:uncharacterized protein A4U43_C04F31670 [Asparagus officinalis]